MKMRLEGTFRESIDGEWLKKHEADEIDYSKDSYDYLFDDELKTATEKLMKFITENGADIKGLNEDKLFEVINKQSKTEGFIKKLKRY